MNLNFMRQIVLNDDRGVCTEAYPTLCLSFYQKKDVAAALYLRVRQTEISEYRQSGFSFLFQIADSGDWF